MVTLNPKSFQDIPLAELPIEEALKAGARRSEDLNVSAFKETSLRFCINGLRSWLHVYVKDYCDRSFYYVLRDLSWHWASFCATNPTMLKVCSDYFSLRKELVENTSYTDLVDRMQQFHWFKEFGHGSRSPCNILMPIETMGIIGETGEAIGIPFSRFFQVGLAWSLSTNKQGLYADWVRDVFTPLFQEVLSVAEKRIVDFDEIRAVWVCRISGEK